MHRNVVANTLADQILGCTNLCGWASELVLMGIPLFHVYGMVAGMNVRHGHWRQHGDDPERA